MFFKELQSKIWCSSPRRSIFILTAFIKPPSFALFCKAVFLLTYEFMFIDVRSVDDGERSVFFDALLAQSAAVRVYAVVHLRRLLYTRLELAGTHSFSWFFISNGGKRNRFAQDSKIGG